MLTEQTVLGELKADERGVIFARLDTYGVRDGVRVMGPEYHRITYRPGAEVGDAHASVQAMAGAIWTPEVIAAEAAFQATLASEG